MRFPKDQKTSLELRNGMPEEKGSKEKLWGSKRSCNVIKTDRESEEGELGAKRETKRETDKLLRRVGGDDGDNQAS